MWNECSPKIEAPIKISIIPTTTLRPAISLMRMGHRSITTSLSWGLVSRAKAPPVRWQPCWIGRRHYTRSPDRAGSHNWEPVPQPPHCPGVCRLAKLSDEGEQDRQEKDNAQPDPEPADAPLKIAFTFR